MRTILALLLGVLLLVPASALATGTCADGGIACGAQCHTSSACGTSQGITFAGTCIGGANQVSSTCQLTRCGSNTPICATGSPTGLNCSSDGDCGSGNICVTSSGSAGCGDGFGQCVKSCNDSTTTTTTVTTTTTTTT